MGPVNGGTLLGNVYLAAGMAAGGHSNPLGSLWSKMGMMLGGKLGRPDTGHDHCKPKPVDCGSKCDEHSINYGRSQPTNNITIINSNQQNNR